MDDDQKKALEAFLLVSCNKIKCDGPWCKIQDKLQKAFNFSDDWKLTLYLEKHHQALKDLSTELSSLVNELSLESIEKIAHLKKKLENVSSCLYQNHLRPPPLELQGDDPDFKERLREVIGSGRDYRVINKSGATISGGCLGSDFDYVLSCYICH